jgi:S-adenosylmethionine decarboxylase proenzyme
MRGSHAIFDFYQAEQAKLEHADRLKASLEKVFSEATFVIEKDMYHQFEPHGVTASLISKNCQLSIHTWPEHHSFTVDFYSSLDKLEMLKFCEIIKTEFSAQEYDMRIIRSESELGLAATHRKDIELYADENGTVS